MSDVKIAFEALVELAAQALIASGFPMEPSRLAAKVLAEADARGIHSHGVVRLGRYIEERDRGFIVPDAEPRIVHASPVSLVIDGGRALGQQVSAFAMEECIAKAAISGMCFATVRNSNHYGISAYYSELALAQGMIGVAMTNTYPLVVPTFGRQAMLGTNPIAVCIPGVRAPFHLDMATSVVPRGKIEVYNRRGSELPAGWAVDETGASTTDAARVIHNFNAHADGGLLPLGGEDEDFGGHKGFGLALLVDLLSAGLSLGQYSRETYTDQGGGVCHFFGAIRLDVFGDPDAIRNRVQAIVDAVCASERSGDHARILYHGQKEAEARVRAQAEGLFLPAELIARLEELGQSASSGGGA